MNRTCLIRGLRIAWSVWWGIVCVLLVVLWVRSYWRLQILEKSSGLQVVQISSVKGSIGIARNFYTIGKPYLSVAAGDAADWRKGGILGFRVHDDNGSFTAIVAPHWMPVLLSFGLAVVPWTSRSRQFSLRTLLMGTTLIAIVLGLVAIMRH